MRLLLFLVILMIQVSCKTSKQAIIASADDLKTAQPVRQVRPALPYKAVFTCDGREFRYDSVSIRNLYGASTGCLAHHAMMGDEMANDIIAWIIREYGMTQDLLFVRSKFRGPKVFEALLSRMGDHQLYVETPQTGEGQPHQSAGATPSRSLSGYAYYMMENVDGIELSEYIFREEGIDLIDDKLDILLYEHSNRYSKWLEKHLKDAWERNLIKLKPYGEE